MSTTKQRLVTNKQLKYLFYLEVSKLCLKIILGFFQKAGWGETSGIKPADHLHSDPFSLKRKDATILSGTRKDMNEGRKGETSF
jgi:hypothetical protein